MKTALSPKRRIASVGQFPGKFKLPLPLECSMATKGFIDVVEALPGLKRTPKAISQQNANLKNNELKCFVLFFTLNIKYLLIKYSMSPCDK
ncbi:MAG: hypothetical protein M3O71_29710 [Bacteroidota bacterium]|nr:hypothetical protein [Bacteroidota bacterium]